MTSRSLFIIILKVLGIFFIKNILVAAANFFPAIIQMKASGEDFGGAEFMSFVILILECLVYFLLTYLLLFKPDWIVDKLKLEQGFQQETFNLNIHRSIILRIVILVLGGLILVDALPLVVEQLTYFIRMKKEYFQEAKIDYVILYASKALVGIFLISYNRLIVNFIEYKRKQPQPGR